MDYLFWESINDDFDEFTEQHWEAIRFEQWTSIKKLLIAQKIWIDHHEHKKKRHEIMQRIVNTSYHEWTKENIAWAEKQNYPLSSAVKIRKNELMQKIDAIEGSASATTMQIESANQKTNQSILVTFFIGNSQQFKKIPPASALNRFRSIVKNVELIINLFRNSVQSTEKSIQSMKNSVQSKSFEISQNWRELIENSKLSFSYDASLKNEMRLYQSNNSNSFRFIALVIINKTFETTPSLHH